MSLINKMLQDLDTRSDADTGTGTTIIEDLQPASETAAARPHKNRTHLIIAALIFILALAVMATVAVKPHIIGTLWPSRTQTAAVSTPPVDQTDDGRGDPSEQATPAADDTAHVAAPTDKATKTVTAASPHVHGDATGHAQNREQQDNSADDKTTVPRSASAAVATPQSKPVKVLRQTTPDTQARESYESAVREYNKGHIAEAERQLRQALSYQPDLIPARTMLTSLVLEENRWQDAQQLLLEGMTRQPDHYEYGLQLAQILTNRQQETEAISVLENGLPYASSDARYLGFLATLYQRHERPGNAADLYSMAIEQEPLVGKWWLGLGLSLESLHKPREAKNAYVRARLTSSLDRRLEAFADQRIEQLSRSGNGESETPQPAGRDRD